MVERRRHLEIANARRLDDKVPVARLDALAAAHDQHVPLERLAVPILSQPEFERDEWFEKKWPRDKREWVCVAKALRLPWSKRAAGRKMPPGQKMAGDRTVVHAAKVAAEVGNAFRAMSEDVHAASIKC